MPQEKVLVESAMEVATNYKRAVRLLDLLLEEFRKNRTPYHRRNVPQNLIPHTIWDNPLMLARFFFYTCFYMRGTIRSDDAIVRLARLHAAVPELFDPAQAARMDVADVTELLRVAIGYRAEQIATFWVFNSLYLNVVWNGDPRAIFTGVSDFEELLARVANKKTTPSTRGKEWGDEERGFLGFQEKMCAMLYYFLLAARLIHPFPSPPPVDFHLARVGLSTGMVSVSGLNGNGLRYEQVKLPIFSLLDLYITRTGVNPIELGDALWLLSRDACAEQPGNESYDIRADIEGKGYRSRRILRPPVTFDNGRDREKYLRSCARCPLRTECTFNVPAGPYYSGGVLLLSPRVDLPEEEWGMFDLSLYPPVPPVVRPRAAVPTQLKHRLTQTDFGFPRADKKRLRYIRDNGIFAD